MEEKHRNILNGNLCDICRDLDPSLIHASLIQGGVLTFEDTEIILAEKSTRARAMQLVEILQRKGPKAFDVFIDALKLNHRHLYDLLQDHEQRLGANLPASGVELLKNELKQCYKSSLERINPVPWLPQHRFTLSRVYTVQQIFYSGALYHTHLASNGQEVRSNQLFTPHEFSDDPKRILIEGGPGVGKSMLFQMLSSLWSKECPGKSCGSPCIHSFQLMFSLHAKNFNGRTSISDVIRECLLDKDFEIYPGTLNKILKEARVLFVIDAYDQARGENQLLSDLIEGRVQRDATVLVGSRPAHLIHKLQHFDSAFVVYGFNDNRQMEYVEKLAKQMKMSDAQLSELQLKMKCELHDLCRNPLIITILCLLCTELSPKLPATQTGIYSAVHEFITDKASQRLQWKKEEVQHSIISPLAKLSFDTYNSKRVISERDFEYLPCTAEEVLHTEYLSKEVDIGPLSSEQHYSFSHQTFQEFLAATHLQSMIPTERQAWLQEVNIAQNEMIITFLFGLLREKPLASMASVVMNHLHCDSLQSFYTYSCAQSHLQLKFMSELNDMPPELNEVIIEHCPASIQFTRECSSNCLKGASNILNICSMKAHSIELIFDLCATSDFIALMKESVKCKGVKIRLHECKSMNQLDECLTAMHMGQEDSYVRDVWILCPQIDESDVRQMSVGNEMRAMRLYGCESAQFSLQFLKAAQKCPKLYKLSMDLCEMDDACMKLMQQLLQNPLLEDINFVNKKNTRIAQLLPVIAELNALHYLSISLVDMDEYEKNSFGNLLQKNTLHWLSLDRCSFSAKLCDVLSEYFPTMPSLRHLLLQNSDIGDHSAFGRTLVAARHLQLQRFYLYDMKLNDDNLNILCSVLPEWTDIKLLFVNAIDFFRDEAADPQTPTGLLADSSDDPTQLFRVLNQTKVPWLNRRLLPICILLGRICPLHLTQQLDTRVIRLQILFGAIARCQNLEKLALADMEIEDALISDLSKMVTSLKELKDLDLRGNKLTDNAFEQLSQCLQLRPKKLQKLDITGNEGIQEETVKQLQRSTTYVMHDPVEFALLTKSHTQKSQVVPFFGLG